MNDVVVRALEEGIRVRRDLIADADKIVRSGALIVKAFQRGKKVLAAGNGGAAGDAQQFTAGFEGEFDQPRRGVSAIFL